MMSSFLPVLFVWAGWISGPPAESSDQPQLYSEIPIEHLRGSAPLVGIEKILWKDPWGRSEPTEFVANLLEDPDFREEAENWREVTWCDPVLSGFDQYRKRTSPSQAFTFGFGQNLRFSNVVKGDPPILEQVILGVTEGKGSNPTTVRVQTTLEVPEKDAQRFEWGVRFGPNWDSSVVFDPEPVVGSSNNMLSDFGMMRLGAEVAEIKDFGVTITVSSRVTIESQHGEALRTTNRSFKQTVMAFPGERAQLGDAEVDLNLNDEHHTAVKFLESTVCDIYNGHAIGSAMEEASAAVAKIVAMEGDPLPSFVIRVLGPEGSELRRGTIAELYPEDLVVLQWSGPRCAPCKQEYPFLSQLQMDLRRSGRKAVVISMFAEGDAQTDLWREKGYQHVLSEYLRPWPKTGTALDERGWSLPMHLVVYRGRILFVSSGYAKREIDGYGTIRWVGSAYSEAFKAATLRSAPKKQSE